MRIGNDHYSASSLPLHAESAGLEVSRDGKGGDGGKSIRVGEHR